jgi:hypothetical protein
VKAARIDPNQTVIVKELLRAGCTVQSLAAIGCGCPDLLIGIHGLNLLIEIKNPDSVRGKKGLNDVQKKFHSFWRGQIATVYTVEDALRVVGDAILGLPCKEK